MHMVDALSIKVGLMMLFKKDSAAESKSKRFRRGVQTKSAFFKPSSFQEFYFTLHSYILPRVCSPFPGPWWIGRECVRPYQPPPFVSRCCSRSGGGPLWSPDGKTAFLWSYGQSLASWTLFSHWEGREANTVFYDMIFDQTLSVGVGFMLAVYLGA